jgi:hypothetical protein
VRKKLVVALALAAALLTGCASTPDTLRAATDSGIAAVGSSSLALELHADGRALTPLTDTVLADAITELTDASLTVVELTPATASEEQQRDAVEQALRDALDAVTGARAALAQGGAMSEWPADLDSARSELEAATP